MPSYITPYANRSFNGFPYRKVKSICKEVYSRRIYEGRIHVLKGSIIYAFEHFNVNKFSLKQHKFPQNFHFILPSRKYNILMTEKRS